MLKFNDNIISEDTGSVKWNDSALETVSYNGSEVWGGGEPPVTVTALCFELTSPLTNQYVQLVNSGCTEPSENWFNTLLEYSTDGENWTPYDYVQEPYVGYPEIGGTGFDRVYFTESKKVYFRSQGIHEDSAFSQTSSQFMYFFVQRENAYNNCDFELSGDASALLDKNGDVEELWLAYTFCRLFNENEGLTDASRLRFPSLYIDVQGNGSVYQRMFQNCTNLRKAPELPAIVLCQYAYRNMFNGCTSLVQPPSVLPATEVPNYAYDNMFAYCSSLTRSPRLIQPQISGSSYCYTGMFAYCSSLNLIECEIKNYKSQNFTNWVAGVSSTGTFLAINPETAQNFPVGASGIPSGWTVDDGQEHSLTFSSNTGGSVALTYDSHGDEAMEFEYSTDGGEEWHDYTLEDEIYIEESVKFRNKSEDSEGSLLYYHFTTDGDVEVSGRLSSLIVKSTTSEIPSGCEFQYLFSGSSITDASQLELPQNTVGYCYADMFSGCTSLTAAPVLPATTAANHCYSHMFAGCTSLTTAPALPATVLNTNCYAYMFSGCTSLTTAPELPATAITQYCYTGMFKGCTSLTEAPALPAATLGMFSYDTMFSGCSSLNSMNVNATNISATNCTANWLAGVSSTGTFKCPASMADVWTRDASGVPSGWTIEAEDERFRLENTSTSSATVCITGRTGTTVSMEYSTNGSTYATMTLNSSYTIPSGGTMWIRCSSNTLTNFNTASTASSLKNFKLTGGILRAKGNISYLVKKDGNVGTTKVGQYCFFKAFSGNTTLYEFGTINVTPTTSTTYSSFREMFARDSQLSAITVSSGCTEWGTESNFSQNVSATGTFYKPASLTIATGTGGIPSGWTVVPI